MGATGQRESLFVFVAEIPLDGREQFLAAAKRRLEGQLGLPKQQQLRQLLDACVITKRQA